ncbi:MAG TPA: GNAT family N-acetyltransferase [Candidatus Acidoferrales bacterium]|nr:GNAT family N-acetyltransferase [Candidatus Acidoferrales bacterium]
MPTSSTPPPEILKLRDDQIASAAAVLARAFHNDPPLVWVLPDADHRARVMPQFFATFVTYAIQSGAAFTTAGTSNAVAIWLDIDDPKIDDTDGEHRAGIDRIPSIIGADAWARMLNIIKFVGRLHEKFAPAKHAYLQWLGVEPELQGRGLGSAVMAPGLRHADAAKLPSYLETFQPRNVPLYQRHGFRIMAEEVEPASGCRCWAFLRPPQ